MQRTWMRVIVAIMSVVAWHVAGRERAWAAGTTTCSAQVVSTSACGVSSCGSAGACTWRQRCLTYTVVPDGCAVTNACTLDTSCGTCTSSADGCSGTQTCTRTICRDPNGVVKSNTKSCTNVNGSCGYVAPPNTWFPYGFGTPNDPVYSFPAAKDATGAPLLPDPVTKDLVGLAAKGNVVLGDYTSPSFQTDVLPNLQPGPTSKTQPYVIDPSDAELGYANNGTDAEGRPRFDGNYNQQDQDGMLPGTKSDGSPRKFYESTLTDVAFKSQVLMPSPGIPLTVDAVLFTNHAVAAMAPTGLVVNGSMVARDDGIVYAGSMQVNHDIRLLSDQMAGRVMLPFSVKRPSVVSVRACSPASPCQ